MLLPRLQDAVGLSDVDCPFTWVDSKPICCCQKIATLCKLCNRARRALEIVYLERYVARLEQGAASGSSKRAQSQSRSRLRRKTKELEDARNWVEISKNGGKQPTAPKQPTEPKQPKPTQPRVVPKAHLEYLLHKYKKQIGELSTAMTPPFEADRLRRLAAARFQIARLTVQLGHTVPAAARTTALP
jgi:hypothetical protein